MKHYFHRLWHALLNQDKELADVHRFHSKFSLIRNKRPSHLTRRKLVERIDCLSEELLEFREAVEHQSLPDQADALVDLVYFAKGTAVMLGLPWSRLWDDVQDANMRKVPGRTKRGHRVDVTKPQGWVGPQTMGILYEAGYAREEWCLDDRPNSPISEARCHDDT